MPFTLIPDIVAGNVLDSNKKKGLSLIVISLEAARLGKI